MNHQRSLSPGIARVLSLSIVAGASVVAFVLLQRPQAPSSFTIDARHTEIGNRSGGDYTTTGTFATEKLRVTGTGSDSISAAGGMQIVGPVQISGLAGSASLIVASTDQDSIVVTRTASALTDADAGAIYSTQTGTYDTTAQQLFSYGVRGASQGSRSAGANALNNYGIYGFARNAQTNVGAVGIASPSGVGVAVEDVGVLGVSDSIGTTAYAIRGLARGGATTNYGIYGTAANGGTNYSGYFDAGLFQVQGAATFSSTVHSIGNLDVGAGAGETTILATDGSVSIGNPTVVTIDGTSGDVTLNNGDLVVSAGTVSVGGNVTLAPAGTIVALGSITADGGLRVFDVAGDGLTSSANTVNVVAAAGGGITANADSVQMTFCAANQVPTMNGAGTAWGCATPSSGITNSAGNNVITKSDGTNLVASTVTDDGTTVAIDTTKLTVDVTTGNTVVLGTLTADGGLRVFDVAGAGLTSSTNTVNAVATANGGLTVNANDIQMTFCAANQVPQMNAGGTQWGCGTLGTGTIAGSATAPGVLYASSANTAATEATVFAWYAAEDTLNIGAAAVTGCGGGACDNGLNVTSAGADLPVRSWNSSATGYNGFAWNNSTPSPQGSIGFGNASVGLTAYRGLNFISSDSADYIFGEATTGTVIARIGMTAGSAFQQWQNGSSAAVGAASTGKLIYNSTTNTFRASLSGGAYTDVITGAVTVNTIPRSASSTTGALVASAVVDDGSTVTSSRPVRATFLSGDVAGSAPTVSSCGTSPTQPTADATNVAGTFGTGTSSSGVCTLNFVGTAPSAQICWVVRSPSGGSVLAAQICGTTTTCAFSGLSDSLTYAYFCLK